MNRVAALVLLVGGALLLSWAVAPATPAPAPPRSARATTDRRSQDPSQNMIEEVAKLRERLAAVPEFPEPSRDPFRFGAPRSRGSAAPVVAEPSPVEPAAPLLPRVVALMDDSHAGAPLWRAVIAMGEDVRIVTTGDTVAGFTVRRVSADGVDLVDPVSLRLFRLVLK